MIEFIRQHILAGSTKNKNAPQILVILCAYAVITSTYVAFLHGAYLALGRVVMSIAVVASYILFERSSLKKTTVALAAPSVIIGIITFGAVYHRGDFLLFSYSVGAALISLTYMKPRSLAIFIILPTTLHAVLMIVLGINLLGVSLTMVHNYLFFTAATALQLILYFFSKTYLKILDELTTAKNEANQAALAKGTFLSNMSHEIRTPLNAIIGMAAIGKSSDDLKRVHYALDNISDAGTHLLSVINDVLDMSKIESGKFVLSPEAFKFEKMIKQVTNLVSLPVEEKSHHLTISIDDSIPLVVVGDDQRLVQVIANILGNAIKFTPAYGYINLNARLLTEKDGLCTIQIEISDSGIGMSQEQQQNLFQAFHQAESNTSRKFGGTGLGLSISKNIVGMMGGEIGVESAVGKGTTFTFTVQLKRASTFLTEERPVERSMAAFHGKSILVAEDIEINREIVIALLEPTGAKITCAENGVETVRIFSENPGMYDIILMDVQMPEMDGFEATRCIRALNDASAKTIPIIAMTANVFREDMEQCLNAGMNSHIGKPLNINEVFDVIRKHLE